MPSGPGSQKQHAEEQTGRGHHQKVTSAPQVLGWAQTHKMAWVFGRGPRAPRGPAGPPRGPTGPHGAPRGPTGPHGAPWGPMGPHGAPRGPTGLHGAPQGPTGPHGAPWGPTGPHGAVFPFLVAVTFGAVSPFPWCCFPLCVAVSPHFSLPTNALATFAVHHSYSMDIDHRTI